MIYQIKSQEKGTKQFHDQKGRAWSYLTPGEYRKISGGKQICADLKKKDSESSELRLTDGTESIGLYKYRAEKKWNEKITGYIPVKIDAGTKAGADNAEKPGAKDNGGAEENRYIRIRQYSIWKGIILPLLLLAAVIGLFLAGYWYANKDKMPGLDRDAVSYNITGLENQDPNSLLLPGIGEINIEAGTTHVEQILPNAKGNPAYFKYSVTLKETGEKIYESGWLEPGKAVLEFELEHALEKGEYPAVIGIETRSLKNHSQKLNGGRLEVTLNVI